jgi:hypothetical protein
MPLPLSEIKTEGNLKVLIQADSGTGKTCIASTFPGPQLFLDFDLKVDSAAALLRSQGKLDQLKNIEVEQFPPQLETSPIDKLSKLISEVLIPQQRTGTMFFKTLVLDSITTFSAATLQHIVKSNPGIKRTESKQGSQPGLQDYGILRREFQRLIPGLLSLPCNVVMLAHIAVEKDEATGQILRHSMMDGSFARELPIYFKEVWRMYIKEGKRMIQTQSDHMFNCRSQIPGLPAHLDVTEGYSAIAKYLK